MTWHRGKWIETEGGPGRPSLFDFFLLGFSVGDALDTLARWDTLPEQERAALGFPTAPPRGGRVH